MSTNRGSFIIYRVLKDVDDEMLRQDEKHGPDRHHVDARWFLWVMQEIGEVAEAISDEAPPPHDVETEVRQVAALCGQWLKDLASRGGT